MNGREPLLPHALAYAGRGWCVIPIRNSPNGGKAAAVSWKRWQTSRPPEAKLREWFAVADLTGLAVVAGEVSGDLYARDFDDPASYRRWAAALPQLALTLPTAQTADGFHVYARWPGAGFADLGDGELRGDSLHYTVLPPSIHPSGAVYRWLVPLPDSDLPLIDPAGCGLAQCWASDAPQTGTASAASQDAEARDLALSVQARRMQLRRRDRTRALASVVRVVAPPSPPSCPVSSASSVSLCVLTDPSIAAAIDATLPGEPGRRNGCLFRFLRRLAALPGLAGKPPAAIRPYVREWHRRALPTIGTHDWETTWSDAVRGWGKVKWPHGRGPFAEALKRAKAAADPPCAAEYDRPEVRLLVRLCRELGALHAPKPFPLPCRNAGEAVGLSKTEAHRFLGMLLADGVIRRAYLGHTGRASEYVYLGAEACHGGRRAS